MNKKESIFELKANGLSKAEIGRQVGLSRERVAQVLGKSPEQLKKAEARRALRYAVQSGELKQLPCFYCGDEKSEAHHEDYDKPLDVIWLCKNHHRLLHKNNPSKRTPKERPESVRTTPSPKNIVDRLIEIIQYQNAGLFTGMSTRDIAAKYFPGVHFTTIARDLRDVARLRSTIKEMEKK